MAAKAPLIPPPAAPARSTNATENRARQAQHEATSALLLASLTKARLIDRISVGTSPTVVPHGLARELSGWLALRPSAASQVFEVAADRDTLTLQASAAVEVDLWAW